MTVFMNYIVTVRTDPSIFAMLFKVSLVAVFIVKLKVALITHMIKVFENSTFAENVFIVQVFMHVFLRKQTFASITIFPLGALMEIVT